MTNRQLFLQNIAQTSGFPLALEIQKAEGVYLFNDTKKYIDLISGIAVSNVGHRHPKVVAAIKNQVDMYLHLMVYGEYVQSPQVQLAEALCKTLKGTGLDNVYFTNSGTEAVEGAADAAGDAVEAAKDAADAIQRARMAAAAAVAAAKRKLALKQIKFGGVEKKE